MKARRLILEADSSTESRAVSPTPVVSSRATKKEKGKAIMTEEVPPGRNKVPLAGIRMKAPFERPVEVLAVSSDIEADPMALEKVAERTVEDVVEEAFAPQKVVSPRTSTRMVILEPSKDPLAEETKLQVLSVVDVLCGQVPPLL
ncbi:hypothetical protein AXG93_169s1000 [Marchantia polymorpha subsp. ruderalis]|uniref:Uncharacterized protein n=1 Tax=Marchantia polymorpha subsp. ruderalis TaxID=1480154 RepID=A0A176VPQ5_MARPO|nr:hypothetical protein AXG93_169s1000 [Marchantia polymorpha subsp. ruderalis]